MTIGMRPIAVGVLAGGVLGGMLAGPVIKDKFDAPDNVEMARESLTSTLPRRIAGLAANFALPAILLVASHHPGASQATRGALMASAAALPGAFWGARHLFDV